MEHKRYLQSLYVCPDIPGEPTDTERHLSAVHHPETGFERGLVEMLTGWLRYADAYRNGPEGGIGADTGARSEWAETGTALRGLVRNAHIGRLDEEVLDLLLCQTLEAEGFNPDR